MAILKSIRGKPLQSLKLVPWHRTTARGPAHGAPPPATNRSRPMPDAFLADAIKIISPSLDRSAECKIRVGKCLRALRWIGKRPTLSPAQRRAELTNDRDALKRVADLGFRHVVQGHIFLVEAQLKQFIVKGGKPPNLLGLATAAMASDLLKSFDKRRTQSVDGSWFLLTSLFYEAATGKENRDPAGWCRKWADYKSR